MASKKLTAEQQLLFDALTPLQQKFSLAIIKGKNQTDAYKAAKGKAKGDNARPAARQIYTNINVQAFLKSVQGEVIDEAIMTREEALKRLTSMGRARITDLVDFGEHDMGKDEDGRPVVQATWRFKDSVKQSPELLDAIAELTAGKDGIKLKLHDARGAIKQMAEMEGWQAPSKIEHSNPDGSMNSESMALAVIEALKRKHANT